MKETDGRYYIGDKVYPLKENEITDYAYGVVNYNEIDGNLLSGIVVSVSTDEGDKDTDNMPDGKYEYGIVWVNTKTRREVITSLKYSWWSFKELTDNQTEFLNIFNEKIKDISSN